MNSEKVSLIIPGRNCAGTIRQCLSSVVPLLDGGSLREIIFVDDGSTDETVRIVSEFPVRLVTGSGRGPGSARNMGWRAAGHPLIWFVDADCVAEPDALDRLLPQCADARVGGISGSYGIMNPESLLARLIHEEIIERHRAMPLKVDFLATFNVLYRRAALEKVDGFNEALLKGQDAELSWRVMAAGYELRFVFESRVKHYHETRWLNYLNTQRRQGYWRVFLHMNHRGHAAGDSYSRWLDHIQPPLAMLSLASMPLSMLDGARWIPAVLFALVLMAQGPLTARLMLRCRNLSYIMFAPMGFLRAYWRGWGMVHGLLRYFLPLRKKHRKDRVKTGT